MSAQRTQRSISAHALSMLLAGFPLTVDASPAAPSSTSPRDSSRALVQPPLAPRRRYLQALAGLDIALDSFPYAGHTTTCDALWMGVPVVTMYGQTAVSRMGLDIMTHLGLMELVADTPEEYVATAVALAQDKSRLRALRGSLHERLVRLPPADAGVFTRQLEAALVEASEGKREMDFCI